MRLEGVVGSQWGVTVGGGVVRGEESGEGVEWRGSGGCGLLHHLLPGRRRGDGSLPPSLPPTPASSLPPRIESNSLLPASKPQPQYGSTFGV